MCLLEEIEQIDDETYMKVTEKFKNTIQREIFVNMSMDRKKPSLVFFFFICGFLVSLD